jgi:hypothetical protein
MHDIRLLPVMPVVKSYSKIRNSNDMSYKPLHVYYDSAGMYQEKY